MDTRKSISTDAEARALKPRDVAYDVLIDGVPGLTLRVNPKGTKVWTLRYRTEAGDQRRASLNAYPAVSLSDAKKRATVMKGAVADGFDPGGDRVARRRELRHGDPLATLAESYFKASETGMHGGKGRPRSPEAIAVDRQRFKDHIEPELGERPFKALTKASCQAFADNLAEKEKASGEGTLAAATVRGVVGLLRSILSYGVGRDLLDANPAAGLKLPAAQERDRLFPESTLKALWQALVTASTKPTEGKQPWTRKGEIPNELRARASPHTALGLRLLALTLVRRSELAAAKWSEFDMAGRVWTIPRERMKNGVAHVVPLSTAAVDVLAALDATKAGEFLLPHSEAADAHIDPRVLTKGLIRTLEAFHLGEGSPHDLRRTGATWLASQGVSGEVITRLLSHTPQHAAPITAVYNRYQYLEPRRDALESWGTYLNNLATPASPNVVQLNRGRRT